MSARPAAVRIDDLAEPRYSDEVRAILDFMEEAGSQLDARPRRVSWPRHAPRPGWTTSAPTTSSSGSSVLCRAMHDEGGFNGAGIMQQHVLIVGLLKNRLLIEDLIRRHPEILDEQIVAPIVICGLPRTGTTHLHNLMSADPALRSLPYWESLEPVLPAREVPRPGAADPRLERTDMALSLPRHGVALLQPDARDDGRAHPRGDPAPRHRLLHHALRDDGADADRGATPTCPATSGPTYAYLRKVLQVLQWLRGGTRWVLKTPQHLEQFPALVDTFPDATFVVTHRDPVSVTASMVTMIAYTARLTRDQVDVEGMGAYWADRLERMLRRCADERDVLPADRTIDVHFDEFMADDLAMVAPRLRPGRPAAGRARARRDGGLHGGAPPRPPRGRGLRPGRSSASTPAERRAGPGLLHRALRRDAES